MTTLPTNARLCHRCAQHFIGRTCPKCPPPLASAPPAAPNSYDNHTDRAGEAAKLERNSGNGPLAKSEAEKSPLQTALDTVSKAMHGNCKPPALVVCKTCSKEFVVSPPSFAVKRQYCSLGCAYKSKDRVKHIKKKDRGTRICVGCGAEFSVHTTAAKAKFCSQPCAASFTGSATIGKIRKTLARTKWKSHSCHSCGKEFMAWDSSARKYCSASCPTKDEAREKRRIISFNSRPDKSKAYSRCKSGWVEFGDQKIFARSQWEANYARYLEWQKSIGEIQSWEHEPHTFWFDNIKRGVRSYLPDFRVVLKSGAVEWHEVKGWMDAKSATKIKRMAKYYPKETLRVFSAPWFKAAASNLASIVPGWEAKRSTR